MCLRAGFTSPRIVVVPARRWRASFCPMLPLAPVIAMVREIAMVAVREVFAAGDARGGRMVESISLLARPWPI